MAKWRTALVFRFERFFHSWRYRVRNARTTVTVLREISRVILWPGLLSVVVTVALIWMAKSHLIGVWAPNWAVREPSSDTYLAVLTTTAAAAGAFLALYFTSMSVVASTAYARVTNEVRQLVLNDEVSGTYLRLIAHAGAVASLGLAAAGIGAGRSAFLMGYVAIAFGIMVLAFIKLGCRIFAFFDPDVLAQAPLRDFANAVRHATSHNPRWLHPAFQDHSRKRADNALQVLSALLDYASPEKERRKDIVLSLLQKLVAAMCYYSHQKNAIPSDSFWFRRRAEFRGWPLQDSSATDIALRTGTTPQPKPVPDHDWIERRLQDIIQQYFRQLLRRDSVDSAITLTSDLSRMTNDLSRHLQFREACSFLSGIRNE